MMKNKAMVISCMVKRVMSAISTVVKAKSMAMRSKTNAIKTRLLMLGLLRNKKVILTAINHKIHALLMGSSQQSTSYNVRDESKAIVLYNDDDESGAAAAVQVEEQEEEDEYPDLRHSLFDLEDKVDDDEDEEMDGGDVMELVKKSSSLEDEIDLVADVFIKRFHRQMKLQKMESFKRYREMMDRSL